jgi:hypothetical protein
MCCDASRGGYTLQLIAGTSNPICALMPSRHRYAITEGKAGSLMCAYSGLRVDGSDVALPMCVHPQMKTVRHFGLYMADLFARRVQLRHLACF